MNVDVHEVEKELKKRLAYPYKWGTKQTDHLDRQTRFIYKTLAFENLLAEINTRFDQLPEKDRLKNYAFNRWFNFYSAMAVEHIFKSHPLVTKTDNAKDKEKDFYIDGIAFDHKTTVFPKQFKGTFNEAINQPQQLIEWLYTNQSRQGRHHLKNRLFVVLYQHSGAHWALKADLQKIEMAVHQYLNGFNKSQLHRFLFEAHTATFSDLIWVLA